MNNDFKIPPKSPKYLTYPAKLAEVLASLVGEPFKLTGKTRTDGSEGFCNGNFKDIFKLLDNILITCLV